MFHVKPISRRRFFFFGAAAGLMVALRPAVQLASVFAPASSRVVIPTRSLYARVVITGPEIRAGGKGAFMAAWRAENASLERELLRVRGLR